MVVVFIQRGHRLMSADGEVLFFGSGTQIQTEVPAHFCGGGGQALPTDRVIKEGGPILQCIDSPIRTSAYPKIKTVNTIKSQTLGLH